MLKKIGLMVIACASVANANAEQLMKKIGDTEILWGGKFTAEAGVPIQAKKYKMSSTGSQVGTTNNHDLGYTTAGSFHLAMRNASNKDFIYGAQMGVLTAERSEDFVGKNKMDRTYVYLESGNWGRFEAGSNEGASKTMKIQGDHFDAGEGSWDKYVALNTYSPSSYTVQLVRDSNFITGAKLVVSEGKYDANHEAARKVTYYTPKIQGFQFGVSYIPDSANKGGQASLPNNSAYNSTARGDSNAITTGLSFDKDLGNARSLGLAVIGEMADMKSSPLDKANGRKFNKAHIIVAGAQYVVGDWSFATSYANRGKTFFQKDITENSANGPVIKPKSGYYYSVGSMYKWHPQSELSLFYLHTNNNTNTLNLITLAGNYAVAEGFKVYAEYSYFNGMQRRDYVIPGANASTTNLPNGTSISKAVMLTGQKNKVDGSAFVTGVGIYF